MKPARHEYIGIIFQAGKRPVIVPQCLGQFTVVPEAKRGGGYRHVLYEDDLTVTIRVLRKSKKRY